MAFFPDLKTSLNFFKSLFFLHARVLTCQLTHPEFSSCCKKVALVRLIKERKLDAELGWAGLENNADSFFLEKNRPTFLIVVGASFPIENK